MQSPGILYTDNHLLVVNKPAGMPSQGDPSGDLCAFDWAKDWIKHRHQKPGEVYLGLLHRLDRPVAGVMAMARTSKAAARLSKAFQGREVRKTYLAVVHKRPPQEEGQLEHWLSKLPGKNIMRAHKKPGGNAQHAVLTYKMLKTHPGGISLLEVKPLTGRQHQIRVQLAAMGCTIVGDVKYGKSEFLPDGSIALLARSLTLPHPVGGQPVTFTAPLPSLEVWRGWGME
ncbi:MAG: RluA family pseudouridine synthase [Bacteroidetes bacterium]|nr:RluA family pseudouridine synthase [Bacteroidota bacterium]